MKILAINGTGNDYNNIDPSIQDNKRREVKKSILQCNQSVLAAALSYKSELLYHVHTNHYII